MLRNDPPQGTRVKFIRQVREVKANEIASLVRAVRKYEVDNPEDEFEVEYHGMQMFVERQDIEEVEEEAEAGAE